MVVVLDEPEIRKALCFATLIPAMERALAAFSTGRVTQPLRQWLVLEEGQRYFGVMPAASDEVMGTKLVSFFPKNGDSALPTVMATLLLVNPDTGQAQAVLDGRYITAMRTAAVSAAVTRRLAAPHSRILALLGSGVQAETHLEALSTVREFDEVRVWSRTPAHAERFAERHGATAMGAEAAVRGADVIVTATPSHTPILMGAWLKSGALVNAIGAPMPTWRELDDAAMNHRLVVESRVAAAAESGDVILSGARVDAEVGEIFAGLSDATHGPTTIFKSVGMAVEDVVTASLVYHDWLQRGGTA